MGINAQFSVPTSAGVDIQTVHLKKNARKKGRNLTKRLRGERQEEGVIWVMKMKKRGHRRFTLCSLFLPRLWVLYAFLYNNG